MKGKRNLIFPITLLVFTLLELYLVKNNHQIIGVSLYLILILLLYRLNEKLVISFFVFQLPILPFISWEFKLAGILGPHEIIFGSSLFVLLKISRKVSPIINEYQKLAISFVAFMFFLNNYIEVKDYILGIGEPGVSWGIILKHVFRDFLYYYSLILLIKLIYFEDLQKYVIQSVKCLAIFLPLSMYFTEELISMGANIFRAEAFMYLLTQGKHLRYVGFFGTGGDQNSAGVFLVGVFGFLLSLYEKDKQMTKYLPFLGLLLLGILLSGSRTASLSLLLTIIVFLTFNRSFSLKVYVAVGVVGSLFLFQNELKLLIDRWYDPSAAGAIDPESDGRVYKWIFYSNWIIEHLETLLFGNQEIINIRNNRAPHNYFIYIVYHAGIFFLSYFLIKIWSLFKKIKFQVNHNELRSFYYITPFFFALMTLNSMGSSIYLWLFLPIGYHLKFNNNL